MKSPSLQIGSFTFNWGSRTYVMGILNVTPDSFSGDGIIAKGDAVEVACLLYTSPSPRDRTRSRMPSSA